MVTSEVHRLLIPTNRTKIGPRLAHQRDQLTVDYDFEEDDGSTRWGRVVFHEVLSFEYRDSSCCRAEDVLPSTEIRGRTDSEYVRVVTDRWHESVGSQAWQQGKGDRGRFRHFTVYFDDACCLNIVASACGVVAVSPEARGVDA